MARFFLVEPSLRGAAGHHFEYALDMAAAAESAGYMPVVAVNRRFCERSSWPPAWRVLPIFTYGVYCRHQISFHGSSTRSVSMSGGLLPLPDRQDRRHWPTSPRRLLDHLNRWRRIRSLARELRQLFQTVQPHPDDLIFFPTFTEFSLLGLADFLRQRPRTRALDWHLQFHFDILKGKKPDFAQQAMRVDMFRQQIAEALRHIPEHRVHFYATTELLAEQYNQLGSPRFQALPYPTNKSLASNRPVVSAQPLRITLAGGMRKEKGCALLARLVRDLWPNFLAPGRIQLVIQGDIRQVAGWLPPETAHARKVVTRFDVPENSPILIANFPLEQKSYLDLIRHTDIGLFLYDHNEYYARASGVLNEMLTAGIPVLVPPACWLTAQIAEPIQQHLDHLRNTAAIVQLNDAYQGPALHVSVPDTASQALISFRGSQNSGYYTRIAAAWLDQTGKRISEFTSVLGERPSTGMMRTLLEIPPDTRQARIAIGNAYHEAPVAVNAIEIAFIADPRGGKQPAGRVGLVAATPECIPLLIRDMVDNYPHYRTTALEFARSWVWKHDALRTIEILESKRRKPCSLAELAA